MRYFFGDKLDRCKVGDVNHFASGSLFRAIKESGNYDVLYVTDDDCIVTEVHPVNVKEFRAAVESALHTILWC